MPDTKRYKSVAVPIPAWEKLMILAEENQRSPAQQIAFLVEVAQNAPTDAELRLTYGGSSSA
jgi:hypothetical protein|tara:strand:- start:447 stop:632 length:186 start_codon:yes stop_codon:yes gene_type:complete